MLLYLHGILVFSPPFNSAYLLFYKKKKDGKIIYLLFGGQRELGNVCCSNLSLDLYASDCKNGSVAPCSPPAGSSVCHPRVKRKREKAEGASGMDPEVEEHGGTKHFSSDWKAREEQTDTEEHGGIHSTATTCDPTGLGKMIFTEILKNKETSSKGQIKMK